MIPVYATDSNWHIGSLWRETRRWVTTNLSGTTQSLTSSFKVLTYRRSASLEARRREFLAIEVAKASWVTGLSPYRNDSKEPDKDTLIKDLPSAIDLVARAAQFSYRHVVDAWGTLIDGRPPSYLLERWERESNEPG